MRAENERIFFGREGKLAEKFDHLLCCRGGNRGAHRQWCHDNHYFIWQFETLHRSQMDTQAENSIPKLISFAYMTTGSPR